jgi:long-chain acyl-CoA synthetase
MVSITRLFDFPYYQQETYNLPVALATKKNGVWEKTSSEEYIAKANAVSRALLRMGVQKDDKIALITSNKPYRMECYGYWYTADWCSERSNLSNHF